jgi:uncharacterized protein YeaO (DUF488 family)
MPQVRARRVYDLPEPSDGRRVLVDRLWPRGLAKEAAHIDEWLKAVAPSDELRRWYGHDPAKFPEFRRRYGTELREPERRQALLHLRELASSGTVTLLTATRDLEHSQAADLAERLQSGAQKLPPPKSPPPELSPPPPPKSPPPKPPPPKSPPPKLSPPKLSPPPKSPPP